MINFDYKNPTRIIFGKGTIVQTGSVIKQYGGTRVLPHFGGGSVIDSAKAIGIGVPYDGDVWDFYAAGKIPKKSLPVARF